MSMADEESIPDGASMVVEDSCEGNESPSLQDKTHDRKPSDTATRSQQWEFLHWDSRRSRERSVESRERSVDSRDSATRERDLRYAEERLRDRERGRREEVILYRGQDSESIHSDSTEEGEIKSPMKGCVVSAAGAGCGSADEKSKFVLTANAEDMALVAGHAENVQMGESTAQDVRHKTGKNFKKGAMSSQKETMKYAEVVKETHQGLCSTIRETEAVVPKVTDSHRTRLLKDTTKGRCSRSSYPERDSDHAKRRDLEHERRRTDSEHDWKRDPDRRRDSDHDHRKEPDHDRRRETDRDRRRDLDHHRRRDREEHWRRDHNHRGDADRDGSPRRQHRESPPTTDAGPTAEPTKKKDVITGRTGGAYIPPARLRMMQEQITDKSSIAYQRIAWEALKKSIVGLVNKANVSNITIIIKELLRENLVRGRGVLCRTIMNAQAASPTFTHVYAVLIAVINTRFPQTGELILKRLVIQFRRAFRRNDKQTCMNSVRFIAHLLNQQVAHEVLVLEILTLLLGNPTDDSVEVAVAVLKECGMKLTELTPKGIHAIFERLRSILHEAQLDKRVQYMIEVMFAIRKDGFSAHPSVLKELELVDEEDQYTHLLALDDPIEGEDVLNVFKFDPEYVDNEEKYAEIVKDVLGSDSEDEHSDSEGSDDEEEEEQPKDENGEIIDNTETNLVALRRTIYLTIQSSLNFEECAHKLLKLELKPGQLNEMCHMILDCCAQQRTYEKFFGLLAQRFCQMKKEYAEPFEQIFFSSYDTIHRFETNKLRNVAKFFAHLLFTDAIPWSVLSHIKLTEDDTTSSSRIFIKILFQELCEYMSLPKLNERIKDPTLQDAFEGLFPRNLPKNTRFAINFFTSIGLGGLTADLREHLKSAPKLVPPPDAVIASAPANVPPNSVPTSSSSSSSSSDSSSGSSSSNSSSESSSDSSSSSEDESRAKKGRRVKQKKIPVDHMPKKHKKEASPKEKTTRKIEKRRENILDEQKRMRSDVQKPSRSAKAPPDILEGRRRSPYVERKHHDEPDSAAQHSSDNEHRNNNRGRPYSHKGHVYSQQERPNGGRRSSDFDRRSNIQPERHAKSNHDRSPDIFREQHTDDPDRYSSNSRKRHEHVERERQSNSERQRQSNKERERSSDTVRDRNRDNGRSVLPKRESEVQYVSKRNRHSSSCSRSPSPSYVRVRDMVSEHSSTSRKRRKV